MDEVDPVKIKRLSEDRLSAPASTESAALEDCEYAALKAELELDAQGFEAESWSCAVDPQFLQTLPEEAIKRQEVIYELVQTEVSHVRTLKLMLRVYARALQEELQLEEETVERLFPQVENLLQIHLHFLLRLRERWHQSLQPASQRTYAIHSLGDILTSQFSGEWGDRMAESYGEFCSYHSDAVGFYKEQLQSNKKFQSLIRRIGGMAILQRLGIPACLLLVTQRITKYPVLLERILHNTTAESPELQEVGRALAQARELIGRVDGQVCAYERAVRLRDIGGRLESRAQGVAQDGRVLRREDLALSPRTLLRDGPMAVRTAAGRLKDVLAVLCSDMLLLLHEKDLKYSFCSVDGKPSVIWLQNLIVREVAPQEAAMFLICTSPPEPLLYQIRTASKEDCQAWMALIRQAVESFRDEEEEEEGARAAQLRAFKERLQLKDAQVAQAMTEKLQILADLAEPALSVPPCDSSHLLQEEPLLHGAIADVENLQAFLLDGVREKVWKNASEAEGRALEALAVRGGAMDGSVTSDPQAGPSEAEILEQLVKENTLSRQALSESHSFPVAQFFDGVLKLSQRLYTLQAVVLQQDSHMELQRAAVIGWAGYGGGALLEQERQRSAQRQREEVLRFERERGAQRQQQERWQQERERWESALCAQEEALRARLEQGRREEAALREAQAALHARREQYQQDLERLRDATRTLERERERLEQQSRLRKNTSSPALLNPEHTQALPPSGLSNGDAAPPFLCPPLPPTPDEQEERPPAVPPRRESMLCPPKTELPVHLLSTTNQHKLGGVQQRIPSKTALGKSREKHDKSRHQRSDSSASLDLRQIFPIRTSGQAGGSLRGKRSASPQQLQLPDVYSELPPRPPAHSPSFHRNRAPPPQSHSKADHTAKEDVFFF